LPENCRLCGQQRELRNSHILPEFLYEELYDSKHRALRVDSLDPQRPKTLQKGLRESLLCDDCEQQFSRYERYAAPVIRKIPNLRPSPDPRFLQPLNVDYEPFKLFQMSLLWRACVSRLDMFAEVEIGGLEGRLHQMLVNERPGLSHNFGCVMFVVPNTTHLHRIIWMPAKDYIDGRECVRFITGRIFWFFTVTSFPKRHPIRRLFLNESGLLQLPLAPCEEGEVLREMVRLMRDV
jgi:hypothetical protein